MLTMRSERNEVTVSLSRYDSGNMTQCKPAGFSDLKAHVEPVEGSGHQNGSAMSLPGDADRV
jgi:hypothetical protein